MESNTSVRRCRQLAEGWAGNQYYDAQCNDACCLVPASAFALRTIIGFLVGTWVMAEDDRLASIIVQRQDDRIRLTSCPRAVRVRPSAACY